MDVDAYCRDKVAAEGTTLYYSFLFVPEDARRRLTALRALGEELREVTDACSDLNVGRSKLAWWSEEAAWMVKGKPRHPVTQAIAAALGGNGLDEQHLRALLDGVSQRLEAGGFASRDELERVTAAAEGALGVLIADVCADGDQAHAEFERNLHAALAQAWIARDPRRHGWRSFSYLPGDVLARHGVTREDVFANRTGDALRTVVSEQARHAVATIDDALRALPENDPQAHLPFVTEAKMERANLKTLTRRGGRALDRPAMITPVRKLWLAWRTARKMGV